MEMVKGVRDLLDNALSANPFKLENDLIPADENRCTTGGFLRSRNLDGHTRIDFGSDSDEDDEEGVILKLWIPNHIDIPHTSTTDISELERILLKKIDEGSERNWRGGILAEELEVPPGDIWSDTKHAENTFFLLKKTIYRCSRSNASRAFKFFMDTKDFFLAIRPFNPASIKRRRIDLKLSEHSGKAFISLDDDVFMDANTSFEFESPPRIDDDFMGSDAIMDEIMDIAVTDVDTEKMIAEEQHMMDILVGRDVGKNITAPTISLESVTDDIADNPVASELIAIDPDAALKGIGKIDDIHWRANQPVLEKKERERKEKKIKTEDRGDEHYFLNSSNVDRVESRARFKCVDPRTLERSEDLLFMQNKKMELRSHPAYDFENFIKPGLLYKGRYGGVRFERSRTSHPDISHFNKLVSSSEMFISGNDDEIMVQDDICNDWLSTFGGFKIYTEDEPHVSFHSAQASFDNSQNNFDYNDSRFMGDDHDNDSFHSAQQV
uniref:Rad21_Rec8 domain-containing protein n=1 Tax=Heterorhabditis bacteriophora TaxID=37862 RepID=A0A1I7XHZ3_HETBA